MVDDVDGTFSVVPSRAKGKAAVSIVVYKPQNLDYEQTRFQIQTFKVSYLTV